MLKQPLLLITLFLFFVQSYSQEPIRFTTKQGLPTNHIYDLVEDVDGFMWFATKQGLVKYDSDIFKTYTIQEGLPNNDTWQLTTDYSGKVWYFSKSTYQGYIHNGKLNNFTSKYGEMMVPYKIYKSKNKLWFFHDGIKTISDGMIVDCGLDIKKMDHLLTTLKNKYHDESLGQALYFINPEAKEVVFINVKPGELLVYSWDYKYKYNIKLELDDGNLEILSDSYKDGLIYNQIGYVAFNKGVLFIDFNKKSTKFLSYLELFNQERIKNFKLKCLSNNIQLSTQGKLLILDYSLNVLARFSFSKQLGNYGYLDSRNHLWLVDTTKGISMLKNSLLTSEVYLKNKKVQKVSEINGKIYAGVYGEGFYEIVEGKAPKEVLLTKALSYSKNHSEIYEIYNNYSTKESFFVSNNQIYYLKQGILEKYKPESISKDLSNTYGIKFISYYKGEYYLITSKNIFKITKQTNEITKVSDLSGFSYSLEFKDHLYFAGSGGLFVLINQKVTKFKTNNNTFDIPILTMYSTKDHLYIGTDGRGVYLYYDQQIQHIKSTDGLSIKRMILENNYMWLATQKGIIKIQLDLSNLEDSKIVDVFYESDGILQNDINDLYKKKNFYMLQVT